jgi:cytochrome c-type biogenesis protein CcmH
MKAAFIFMVSLAVSLAIWAAVPAPAKAVNPDEILADAALEARARDISRTLRCLVCQNQSIDDSDAGLARDLRILVRERLTAGESDEQVIAFVVARYGDFALLKPPFKPTTWLLWLGPALVLVLGAGAMVLWYRRRATATEPPPLSDDEHRALRRMMDPRDAGDSRAAGDGTDSADLPDILDRG